MTSHLPQRGGGGSNPEPHSVATSLLCATSQNVWDSLNSLNSIT